MTTESANFVYVQLGKNESPTFLTFVRHAKHYSPDSDFFLITDCPDLWADFPGEILLYEEKDKHPVIRWTEKKFPERKWMSGGYWIYTLERLFALSKLNEVAPNSKPVIHLESDVLSFIDQKVLQTLSEAKIDVGVPRYSQSQGIASVLYSASPEKLQTALSDLASILYQQKKWCGDMTLLGLALTQGVLHELPSRRHSEVGKKPNEMGVLFDGLAFGQYLFGQDPVHTGGIRVSGHLNEFYPDELDKNVWEILNPTNRLPRIAISWPGSDRTAFELATIHVHSKEAVNSIADDTPRWRQAIDEANSITVRKQSEPIIDNIHSASPSLKVRLLLAWREGLGSFGKRWLKKLFNNF